MILDLSDSRQQHDHTCGPAALESVFRFWGKSVRGVTGLANPVQGMSPDTVEAILRRAGFGLLSGNLIVPDLRHFTRLGRPVLCPITTDAGEGHWVAVAGVSRGRVHYQCPTHGPASLRDTDWLPRWADATRFGHGFERWGIVPTLT